MSGIGSLSLESTARPLDGSKKGRTSQLKTQESHRGDLGLADRELGPADRLKNSNRMDAVSGVMFQKAIGTTGVGNSRTALPRSNSFNG